MNIITRVTGSHFCFVFVYARKPGAAFSKVPRKILGKLLILRATDTQLAMSSRGYSATVEHCTNRPISSVQRSNRKLCSSSSNSNSKIRSFLKIFLGTFENAAPERQTEVSIVAGLKRGVAERHKQCGESRGGER